MRVLAPNAVILDDDDDGDDASQEAPESAQGYNEQQYSYALYGTLSNKIVGVRFYDGYATTGEMVVCRREPHNPYDANAIQVLNVQNRQIGHLPRTLASRLAKYMDNRSLLIEAILTGPKGVFDCPIELKLYGTNEPTQREQLVSQMRADKLPVGHFTDRQRKKAKAAKEREKLAKEAAKQAKKRGGVVVDTAAGGSHQNGMSDYMAGSSQGDGLGPGPSMEDIISGSMRFNPRNLDQMMEEFGVKEQDLAAMPKASQPEALQTKLHPFQLQALQWMLDRESPQLPDQGTKDVFQLWQRHSRIPGAFTNLATNFSVTNPALASGGILAGIVFPTGRRDPDACGATLILAPVSVMSNWSIQIKKHVKEQYALRVMFWHGQRKQSIDPQQIEKYDVVISTYESVSSEWYSQKSPTVPRKSGPFSVKWRRVILDEGHNIRCVQIFTGATCPVN
ncbi:hypothetical protein J1614_011808 [Plenodomus biglobosus]|nr:hypothetical protein J1614_011808 [Plenodomus biglobosus]